MSGDQIIGAIYVAGVVAQLLASAAVYVCMSYEWLEENDWVPVFGAVFCLLWPGLVMLGVIAVVLVGLRERVQEANR